MKWVHVGRFAVGSETPLPISQVENPAPLPTGSLCKDSYAKCGNWSMTGECYKNHIWMVGTPARPGHCLQSCLRCDIYNAHLNLIKLSQEKGTNSGEATGCMDKDERCAKWSTEGECINNAVWMVGTAAKPGNCMSACMRCDVWQKAAASDNSGLQAGGAEKPQAAEVY